MTKGYGLFCGSSPEEIEATLTPLLGATILNTPKSGFPASEMHGVILEGGGLFWQRGFDGFEFQVETTTHLQIFNLSGGMSIETEAGKIAGGHNHQLIIPSNMQLRKSFMKNSQQIYLAINDDYIQRKYNNFFGEDRDGAIVTRPEAVCADGPRDVSRLVAFSVVKYLKQKGTCIDDIFVKETADYLTTLFVLQSCQREPPMATKRELDLGRNMQLVIEYIEANLGMPLALEDLVAISGCSARTLLRAFRRKTGKTPMAYIKQLRLEWARKLFLSGTDDISVIRTVYGCGFGNTGHFSREYRKLFGELPSDTLWRRRRG